MHKHYITLPKKPTLSIGQFQKSSLYNPGLKLREIVRCIDVFYNLINCNNFRIDNKDGLLQEVKTIVLEDTKINNSREDLISYGPNSIANYIQYFYTKYDGSIILNNVSIDVKHNIVKINLLGNNKNFDHTFQLNDYGDRIVYLEF